MIDNNILKKLSSIFQSAEKEYIEGKGDGWINLAKFGPLLNSNSVDYKELGFEKLGAFIVASSLFETYADTSKRVPVKYVRLKANSTRPIQHDNMRVVKEPTFNEEEEKIMKRLRLKNKFFIGQFSFDGERGHFKITDIRNTDFTKIEDKERGIRDLAIRFKSSKYFSKFAYYKFTWKLISKNPIAFGIDLDEDVTMVTSKDTIECINNCLSNYPLDAAKKITGSLDTLSKQLTQSGKEVFIYELLQNANDYPQRGENNSKSPVDVDFHITSDFLTFQHTGAYFNAKNVAAICNINDGEKSDNVDAIGYKGIGFKTVFLDNDYVFLQTGTYTFRFDKSFSTSEDAPINTPWQIYPLWTEPTEVSSEVNRIFSIHPNDKYKVKFALKPRDKRILTDRTRKDNYIDLFSNVFESERVILFIPNIQKVSVFFDNMSIPSIVREKNNMNWCVSQPLIDVVPENITERINDVLTNQDADKSDGYDKIPEKYLNFHKTTIKFACKKEGRKLLPVEDSILYCYLPAKRADWGFNFLMNTDMVPNGARDDIEDIELNHEIAKIAGRQFFYWIKQLIESEEYDLDSIFALIPDFDECKKRRVYKTFIEEFQEEFETLIKEEPFVPCVNRYGEQTYKCIDNIINDMTRMTANGVISDEDFISLMKFEEYSLPVDELRLSESFMDFLYKHSPSSLDIKVDDIVGKCEETDFQTWLTNSENNTRFIKHWLHEDELNKFAKKKIFIEYEGELFTAGSLYYDFDTNCSGIGFLRRFIPHLCDNSRIVFEGEENWEAFANKYFQSFSASSMITTYILSNEDAMALLNVSKNSVEFYRYLSLKDVDLKTHSQKIPYITEDGVASTDYANYRYFFNDDVHSLTCEKWLGENVINVLSNTYFDGLADDDEKEKLINLFARLGFCEFVKDTFITTIIIGDADFCTKVNVAIENNHVANKAFVDYVFSCEIQLKENCFKDYVLRCVDTKGIEVYLCNDDVRYFNQDAFAQNSTYADNIHHAWLQDNMMYALSNAYFAGYEKEEARKLESFIRQQFGVKTFTDKSFFVDVVIKNKAVIYASLVDEATMLAFLKYLKRDAERLFDGSISFNEIKDMPLLAYDGNIFKTREANIQYIEYNEEAKVLCEKTWCPKTYVLLSQKYTEYFSQDTRQLFKIAKFDINNITDIIASNTALRQSINSVDQNIDFWRWIKANQKQIHAIDKFKNMPLLDKSNSLSSHSSLYISDTYQQEQIESLVTKYVKSAQFVSSSYVEDLNENEKNEWLKLFKKLGLKSDNKDVLFSDILPNLPSFDTESLDSVIAMMTKHIKDLKEKWTEKRGQIIQLRVRTQSGEYKTLNQVTIINVDEESVSEPFKYITLSNEVHPDIIKANKELLLLISAEFQNCNLITTKQRWINAKVKDYLDKFADDENSITSIHVKFVREVAKIQNEYDIDSTLRKQIKYLVKSNETTYMNATDLTLGSAYSPTCDFEANGISELPYLSDIYIFEGNKDTIKSYFKSEGLHQNMTRGDLKYLAQRTFACYFWSSCFSRRLVEYGSWIDEGCFKNLVCIPTENSVQKAEHLYAPHVAGYAVRAKAPNWEENVPCKAIVDSIESRDARELFEKLDFRNSLSFEDCLYYLARVSHPREDETHFRSIVINWMLSSPYQNEEMIDNYRKTPTAEWRNGKGQKKHITELYAIHPEAIQERNIFRGDEYVMQTSAFPINTESFVKVCEIFKIKCLTKEDFVATPIGKNDETAKMVAILRPRLLVLSAIENPEKFQELYEKYNTKLSQFHFVVCEKIDLGYDTIHNDVERIYNDDNHLYYVSSWKHNRTFTKFCSRLKRIIGFDVYDNVCEDVLDESIPVEDCIEKYCSSLRYDEEFRVYLTSLDLSINVEIEDEPPTTLDEDYYKEASEEPEQPLVEEQETTSVEPQIESTETVSANQQELQGSIGTDNVSLYEETNVPEVVVDSTNENQPNSQDGKSSNENTSNSTSKPIREHRSADLDTSSCQTSTEEKEDTDNYDSYEQIDEDNYTKEDTEEEVADEVDEDYSNDQSSRYQSSNKTGDYNPDSGGYMGSVDKDKDYQPIGDRPYKPRTRKHPKNFTKEEVERLRSHGTPLELESLPPTKEEIDLLAQCNIKPEQIADTNYLAQLRLYLNLTRELHEEPEESMEEFVRNADDVAIHKLKNNGYGDRYIHTCSAARGVMYVSPSVWNKMVDDKWKICVYLDGQGKNFHYINNAEEFIKLVEKDDVVIKITGKKKVDVVKALYTGILENVKGTAYTLIRVAARTNMDAVFAHYVGAMAEAEDGNDDYNNNDY